MKLIPGCKKWHKMWSIRLAILAAALGALELTLPLWQGVVPQHVFAALSTITAALAAVARVVQQETIRNGD